MITSYEIEHLAKAAAAAFLQNKIPLNDTIGKFAEERNLNYEQTQRIVEEANTQVYLNLFNQAKPEDRYIEFPIADVKKIASHLREKTKSASLIPYLPKFNDYFLPPKTDYIPAPRQTIADSEKLASIKEVNKFPELPAGQYAVQFQKLHKQAQDKLYQNSLYEIGFAIEKQANHLINIAKQDILSKNGTYAELELVFTDALAGAPKVAEYLLGQLPKTAEHVKMSGTINRNHWFYKEVVKLAQLLDAYEEAKKNPKKAHEKIAVKGLVLGLGIGLPAAVVAGAGLHEVLKTKKQMASSPLTLQNPGINKVQ